MQEGGPQQQIPHGSPKHSWLVMYFIIVLASFVAVGGTAAGVYYLQQGQIDQLASENEKLFETHRANTTTTAVTFEETTLPFKFAYPSNWSLTLDRSDNKLAITATSPSSTVELEGLSAAPTAVTSKGAHILITAKATTLKKVAAPVGATNVKESTIAQQSAVTYAAPYKAEPAMYAEFVKDGQLYSLIFVAEGDEADSKYVANYQDLIKSFAF